MVRIVFAEDNLLHYLTSLSANEGYVLGLILGQNTGQNDFVIHLTKTPQLAPIESSDRDVIDNSTVINSIQEIREFWIADHAKHVTRMLPGGFEALGIFIVGPSDIFTQKECLQKVMSITSEISKILETTKYLSDMKNDEKLVLNLNSRTKKYICKSIANDSPVLKPVEWKFQKTSTKWHKLETVVDFDHLFLTSSDNGKSPIMCQQLQDIMKDVSKTIESASVIIRGAMKSSFTTLEEICKKKNKNTKDSENNGTESEAGFKVDLFIPCKNTDSPDFEMKVSTGSMQLMGQLVSETYLHEKGTLEEAAIAVKQDIVRSLTSRLEMHWNSFIDEENSLPEENTVYHEPPRRVLVKLPLSQVTMSDYLFPGEEAKDALISLHELLDLRFQECHIIKDLELQVDTSELLCPKENKASSMTKSKGAISQNPVAFIIIFGLAFIVALIAFFIHMYRH